MDGTVFWITGLAGAGKTSVGRLLYGIIKRRKDNVVLLDGDALRASIASDLGYSLEERHECAGRYARLCRLLAGQGIDVICCTISMFEDVRQWNRANNGRYLEIYLKVPPDVLESRDQKNLYTESRDELVGFGVGMEEPEHPDLVLMNDGSRSPEDLAQEIWKKVTVIL